MSEELPAPLKTVCRVAGVSRSAACEQRRRRGASAEVVPAARCRPGPAGAMDDRELLVEIRQVLANSPFTGEGHRKVWARLRRERGVFTSRKRVLRLTRDAGLLAPTPQVRKRSRRLHDGTITVAVPDTLWATDATEGWTAEGRCAVFAVVDHASGEAWCDASLRMDRWAAADLLREVASERFGSVQRAVCSGLALRYDGGPCFRSAHYQAEIDHLGIARSPAYHYEPETNGCVERFIGLLKEQVLWIERFESFEQLRAAVRQFARTYDEHWLLERHGYRTPIEAREHLLRRAAMA